MKPYLCTCMHTYIHIYIHAENSKLTYIYVYICKTILTPNSLTCCCSLFLSIQVNSRFSSFVCITTRAKCINKVRGFFVFLLFPLSFYLYTTIYISSVCFYAKNRKSFHATNKITYMEILFLFLFLS